MSPSAMPARQSDGGYRQVPCLPRLPRKVKVDDKLWDDKLCVGKLCVSKLCVSKLCVSKLCVSKLCVSKEQIV